MAEKTRNTLTPGQAAELFNVSPQMVVKWITSGMLKGHKLPGSSHRRILREDLIQFAKEHGLPLSLLEG